ncbi:hypothetical protein MKW92_038764 [Papaver armeniacum]|nr:hypothetical protein MKW92_038764 [Papaver armeniacum]
MGEHEHPRRLILHDFVSLNLCKFIHKSCCTVGYRPNVFSTTLSHLIATCGHLLIPFVSIRERLKDKVEEFFGCEYELFVEFTGLISWTKGASIGWHSDDNRSYLKQRDFAAVCYLNNHGKDFKGGVFHFQEGEPTNVVPMAGDLVIYTADSCNIHSVDEGERLTLTLWFTRDSSHDEDVKLISLLDDRPFPYLPLPASSNMYWFFQDQAYHFVPVVQFYCWKATELPVVNIISEEFRKLTGLSCSLEDFKNDRLKVMFLGDQQHVQSVFGSESSDERMQSSFNWAHFASLVAAWEDYSLQLHKELVTSLPHWRMNQSMFTIVT